MALSVAPVNNPTFTGMGTPPQQHISGVISATPGSNGFAGLTQPSNAPSSNAPAANPYAAQISELQRSNQLLQNLYQQQANKPVAPTLNYNAISANALKQAQSVVNPLYTQKLNEYLQQEATVTQQQQDAAKLAIEGSQSQLQNTLAKNTQSQTFAGQNTALNIGNINQGAANRQQNEGMNFDEARIQMEQQLGQSGISEGLGAQQAWTARNKINVAEQQAQNTDQYNRNQQLLSESNTFAQLAESNKYASTVEGQAEAKTKLDLGKYMQNAAFMQTQYQESLTAWQTMATNAMQQNFISQNIKNQIGNLRGGVQGAAGQAWSGLMGTMEGPATPTETFAA